MKRILIPLIITVALSATIVWASQLVTTQEFVISVEEAIIVGDQATTTLLLYPGETQSVEVIITNLSDNALSIEIDASVEPAGGILVVDCPSIEVPAGETVVCIVSVTADTDIAIGTYTLTIEVKRE